MITNFEIVASNYCSEIFRVNTYFLNFSYIWHLYLSAFCFDRMASQQSRILANTFRMVQALCSSVPLLILNLYTLMATLKVEGQDDALDISQLTAHLDEGSNGKCALRLCPV